MRLPRRGDSIGRTNLLVQVQVGQPARGADGRTLRGAAS
eukprot:COSAG01_NODE_11146_length_1996_cov_524.305746_1_plen_38_part_10